MEGKIIISKLRSTNPDFHNKVSIRVEDSNTNLVFSVQLNPEDFALAVTGQELRPCNIVYCRGEEFGNEQ